MEDPSSDEDDLDAIVDHDTAGPVRAAPRAAGRNAPVQAPPVR